jgi:HlyD family secretion protein
VKVQILHPDDHLRPDMNATVAFVDRTHSRQEQSVNPVVTIPAAAVQDGSVFVVVDGKAVRRPIQTFAKTPQGIQVSHGLMIGEDVILNPPSNLSDGERVRVKGDQP